MLVSMWLACGPEPAASDTEVPAGDETDTALDTAAPDTDTGGTTWPDGGISGGLGDWQAFLDAVEAGDATAASKAYEGLTGLVLEADASTGGERDAEVRALLGVGREDSLVEAAWTVRGAWIAWARTLLSTAPDQHDPVAALASVRELVAALGATVAAADDTWNESISGELDEALDIARKGADADDAEALGAGLARLDGSLDAMLHRRLIGAVAGYQDREARGAWKVLVERLASDERNEWGGVQITEALSGPRSELDQALVWQELDEGFGRRALGALSEVEASGVAAAAEARQAWFVTSVGAESRVDQAVEAERAAWDAAVLAVYADVDASEALADREASLCEHLAVLSGSCEATEALPDTGLGALAEPGWSWKDADPSAPWAAAWVALQDLEELGEAWAGWAVLAPLANLAEPTDLDDAFARLARAQAAGLQGEAAIARAEIAVGAELGILSGTYALSGDLAEDAAALVDAPDTLERAQSAWESDAVAALDGIDASSTGLEALVSARLRWSWARQEDASLVWRHGEQAARRGDADELAWAIETLDP